MNIKFKAPFATAVAIGVGITLLAAYFIPGLANLRFIFLRAGLVLAAVALMVGIINLLSVHFRKMARNDDNSGYSLILVVALIITLLVGFFDMFQSYMFGKPNFKTISWLFTYIQFPIETSLMAVMAISLTYAAAHFLRKNLDLYAITFFFILIMVLISTLSVFMPQIPLLDQIRHWIVHVPALGGARGLLLGIALGTIATGLRILIGTDRPYGG